MPEIRIGFFGEAMIEISGQPLQKNYGGDVLNTAVYLSRLNEHINDKNAANFKIYFITALGDDSISSTMIKKWQNEGIETELIKIVKGKQMGLYIVETTAIGDRNFHYWRSDSAFKHCFNKSLSLLEETLLTMQIDYLYLTGITLAVLDSESRTHLLELLGEFNKAGGHILFDGNYRPSLWDVDVAKICYLDALALTDIAFLTDMDEKMVFGSSAPDAIIARCNALDVPEIVIMRGADSSVVHTGNETIKVKANKTEQVVDTCAAGDSFAAGYLFHRLAGKSCVYAAKAGHDLAALVIQHHGAIMARSNFLSAFN